MSTSADDISVDHRDLSQTKIIDIPPLENLVEIMSAYLDDDVMSIELNGEFATILERHAVMANTCQFSGRFIE